MNPFVKQNGIVTQVGMITQLIHRDKMIVKDTDREREWGQSPEKKNTTENQCSRREKREERDRKKFRKISYWNKGRSKFQEESIKSIWQICENKGVMFTKAGHLVTRTFAMEQ